MNDDLQIRQNLVRNDWVLGAWKPKGRVGKYLHSVEPTADQWAASDWLDFTDIETACGKVLVWAAVGGVFDRMGTMRCPRCCDVLGYPRGKGSPKNDDACRAILGLPA